MTNKEQSTLLKIEKHLSKCNGDCKNCQYFEMATSGSFYAMYCGYAEKNGYRPLSDTIRDLKQVTVDCIKFELS